MTIKEVSEKYQITQDTLRYYERIGMIPAVPRTSGGIRNYGEADLGWIELALCMRNAGLPVESMIEYVHLFQEGDETIPARLHDFDQTDIFFFDMMQFFVRMVYSERMFHLPSC